MTQMLRNVVAVVACVMALMSGCYAKSTEGEVAVLEEGRLLDPEIEGLLKPYLAVATPGILSAIIIIGVIFYFYEMARGITDRLEEENEEYDSHEYDYGHDYDYNILERRTGYQPNKRSVAGNTSLFNSIMDSIDPVETTFNILQVGSPACRSRTVCELQRAASKVPLLGSLLHRFSQYFSSLERYRDAQAAGAALEDCALLFSECPTFSLRDDQENH